MTLSRRQFLKNGSALVSATLLVPPWLKEVAAAADKTGASQSGRILVVVELTGGNDGLNTVIPYQSGLYRDMRRVIGIDGEQVLKLNDQLALHPTMGRMRDLFKAGRLSIIQGVGYPNPNRSHFRSMEIWQTANPERIEYYGWLGKFLDDEGHWKAPLSAVSMGLDLPLALVGPRTDTPALESIEGYGLLTAGDDRQKALELYRALHAPAGSGSPAVAKIRSSSLEALESSERLKQRVKPSKAEYPNNRLAQSLKEIARILSGDVGTVVAYARLGGFDTHAGQPAAHNRLLASLSDSIGAFWDDITARGLADRTMLFTFSEFGRRVRENGGQGTDHGTAGPMFVLGSRLKGSIHGDIPDLRNLDGGDLKHQIDFRSVYATLLEDWLEADAEAALGGKFGKVGFI